MNNELPAYEKWKQDIECDVMWRRYSGKRDIWEVGERTVVDKNGHAINHCGYNLIKEALSRLDFSLVKDGSIVQEVDFGFPIGYSECVETSQNDSIVYLQRHNRANVSRFVLEREPEVSNTVVLILDRVEDSLNYIFRTAYVGNIGAREPWDKNATPSDVAYWRCHALVAPSGTVLEDDMGDSTYWTPMVVQE